MQLFNSKEASLLLDIITQCYRFHITEEEFNEIIEQLKKILPFDYWALVYCTFDSTAVHIDEISWFEGIEGFQEAYIGEKLFLIDPISLTALEQAKKRKTEVQFWAETYSKYPESEFYEKISKYDIVNYNGYSNIFLPNLVYGVGFSIAGPNISATKDPKIVRILEMVIPHLAYVAVNGKVGKYKNLTEKQFNVLQLRRAGLSTKEIGQVVNITRSGVEKHFDAIRRKLGVNNNKELAFRFTNGD